MEQHLFLFTESGQEGKARCMREKKGRAWFELHTSHPEKVTFRLRSDVRKNSILL